MKQKFFALLFERLPSDDVLCLAFFKQSFLNVLSYSAILNVLDIKRCHPHLLSVNP